MAPRPPAGVLTSWTVAVAVAVAVVALLGLTSCVPMAMIGTDGLGVPVPGPDRPLRVMALGDSITLGGTTAGAAGGGYRRPLWERLVGQDRLEVEFVGSQRSAGSELRHEGHGGFRIDQLRAVLDQALAAAAPDVILLHIGSNDIGQGYRLDTAPQRLQELGERICTLLPQANLVVASIAPIVGLDALVAQFNGHVPSVVAGLQAGGCRAHHVDMSRAVLPTELPDGVHPTDAGYASLAAAWYPQVRMAYDRSFESIMASAVNDDVLHYTGYWRYEGGRAGSYWSDRHVSANTGDTAAYRFTGSVVVYGTRGPDGGLAAVSMDGGPETMVDYYAPDEREQEPVYRSPPAGPGPHTVMVRVTGLADPASAGTAVAIDRLGFADA